jgi:hypothetical protein
VGSSVRCGRPVGLSLAAVIVASPSSWYLWVEGHFDSPVLSIGGFLVPCNVGCRVLLAVLLLFVPGLV